MENFSLPLPSPSLPLAASPSCSLSLLSSPHLSQPAPSPFQTGTAEVALGKCRRRASVASTAHRQFTAAEPTRRVRCCLAGSPGSRQSGALSPPMTPRTELSGTHAPCAPAHRVTCSGPQDAVWLCTGQGREETGQAPQGRKRRPCVGAWGSLLVRPQGVGLRTCGKDVHSLGSVQALRM